MKQNAFLSLLNGMIKRFWGVIQFSFKLFGYDLKKTIEYLSYPRNRKRMMINILQFFKAFYMRLKSEAILKEAAALTYITLLGFIPFLLFAVFLLPEIPMLNIKTKFNEIIFNNFMPASADKIGDIIQDIVSRRSSFNIFNFIVLLVTSYSLFKVIEDTFDRVLSMDFRPAKNILTQFIKFLGTVIFGFVIILMLFSSSSLPYVSSIIDFSVLKKILLYILPIVMQFVVLLFLYVLIPSIKVSRGALFRGVFWTTVIWIIVKTGFDWYIYNLTNIKMVYGVVASLPIILFWIYINWVIILGGIVLVSILESKNRIHLNSKVPKNTVKITVEMYSDRKLNKKIEDFLYRHEIINLAKLIDKDDE